MSQRVYVCLQVLSCTAIPYQVSRTADPSSLAAARLKGKRKYSDNAIGKDCAAAMTDGGGGGGGAAEADDMLLDAQPEDPTQQHPASISQQQQLPGQLPLQQPRSLQLPQPPPLLQQQPLSQQLPGQLPQQVYQDPDHQSRQGQSAIQLPQNGADAWGAELARAVAWCHSKVVEQHLLTELQVGIFTVTSLQLPDLTSPYLAFTYLTLPYLTLPYLTLPYLTLPYLTLPIYLS